MKKTEIYVSKFPHDMQNWFVEKATLALLSLNRVKEYINNPDSADKEYLEYAIETTEIYLKTILDMCEGE